jgi:hypothetical protein
MHGIDIAARCRQPKPFGGRHPSRRHVVSDIFVDGKRGWIAPRCNPQCP